jgi:hypothetical protein
MLVAMPSGRRGRLVPGRTPAASGGLRPARWHGAAALLGPVLLLACRLAPSEAPPPDASAWPDDDDAELRGEDEAPPDPAPPVEAEVGPPLRPRPPHAIFRDELRRATGPGPAYLLRQLGPEPFRHQGHFVGWEITQLFPEDPGLCAPGVCDLELGDVILGVNGHRLDTPQDLSTAFEALPGWTHLRVQSLREGKRRDATYTIVDDPG